MLSDIAQCVDGGLLKCVVSVVEESAEGFDGGGCFDFTEGEDGAQADLCVVVVECLEEVGDRVGCQFAKYPGDEVLLVGILGFECLD